MAAENHERSNALGAVNLFDLESKAATLLPDMAWSYYCSGANDEITLRENHLAYERIQLNPRMLVDVSSRNMETTILGQRITMPLLVAPTAFQCLAHPDGERATAKAAGIAGTIMTLSTLATSTIEEVAEASSGPLWFQLYVYKDRGITRSLVERAAAAGYKAIVLTVDSPMLGRRERDVRNRFSLPAPLTVKNLLREGLTDLPSDLPDSGLSAYIASLYDTALTWKDVEWLKSITDLPVLVKGIMRADDARKSIEHGADGIIVSNHGGRQLDTVPATIAVLPAIVDEVGGDTEILIDGGVRRGTDILKALALGARAVLIGRPVLWGLACDGAAGVTLVLELLRQELDLAMVLSGCQSLSDITPDLIFEKSR